MREWDYIKKLGGRGILQQRDVADLKSQRAKVLHLMLDGTWHTTREILLVAGGTEGLRRMRELRDVPYITIERKRHDLGRNFWYRLVYTPKVQGDMLDTLESITRSLGWLANSPTTKRQAE